MCRPNLLDIIFSRTIWFLKRTQKGLSPSNRFLRMFFPMLHHIFHMCKDSTAVTTYYLLCFYHFNTSYLSAEHFQS